MHFILLLKIIFAVGNHLPVAPPSAWERKRNREKQLKNICAVQLRFLFCALPGVNLVFKLAYQWGCFQAALFSHLCRARLQRGQGAAVRSVLCTSKEQGLPRTTGL